MIREDNCLCEDDPCKAIIRDCGSKCNACDFSGTLEIFKEFNEVYKERLKKAEEACGDISQLKIKTLEDWVADLTEQNTVLVETVEALEREALYRLELGINAQKCSELEVTGAGSTGRFYDGLKKDLDIHRKLVHDGEKQNPPLSIVHNNPETGKDCKACKTRGKIQVEGRGYITSSGTEINTGSQPDPQMEELQEKLYRAEEEISLLKNNLTENELKLEKINEEIKASEKSAREMRAALTAEVADKHDQVLSLRREVQHLEEKLRQADMQTHFKDDIIKELRKEIKVSNNKVRDKDRTINFLEEKNRSNTMEHDPCNGCTSVAKVILPQLCALKEQVDVALCDMKNRFDPTKTFMERQSEIEELLTDINKCVAFLIQCAANMSTSFSIERDSSATDPDGLHIPVTEIFRANSGRSSSDGSFMQSNSKQHLNELSCSKLMEDLHFLREKSLDDQKAMMQLEREMKSLMVTANSRQVMLTEKDDSIQCLREVLVCIEECFVLGFSNMLTYNNQSGSAKNERLFAWKKNLLEQFKKANELLKEVECRTSSFREECEELANVQQAYEDKIQTLRDQLIQSQNTKEKILERLTALEETQKERFKLERSSSQDCEYNDATNEVIRLLSVIKCLEGNLKERDEYICKLRKDCCNPLNQFANKGGTKDMDSAFVQMTADKILCQVRSLSRIVDDKERQVFSQLEGELASLHKVLTCTEQELSSNMQSCSGPVLTSLHNLRRDICCVSKKTKNYLTLCKESERSVMKVQENILGLMTELKCAREAATSYSQQVGSLPCGSKPSVMEPRMKIASLEKQIDCLNNQVMQLNCSLHEKESYIEILENKISVKSAEDCGVDWSSMKEPALSTDDEVKRILLCLRMGLHGIIDEMNEDAMNYGHQNIRVCDLQHKERLCELSDRICQAIEAIGKRKSNIFEGDDICSSKNLLIEHNDMMKKMNEDFRELNLQIQNRDKMIENQQETIDLLQNSLCLKENEIASLTMQLSDMVTEKADLEKFVDESGERVRQLEAQLKECEDNNLEIRDKMSVTCKVLFAELKDHFENCCKEMVWQIEAADYLNENNIQLTESVKCLQELLKVMEKRYTDCKSEKEMLQKDVYSWKAMIEDLRREMSILQEVNSELQKNAASFESQAKSRLAERESLSMEVDVYESKIKDQEGEISSLKEVIERLSEKIKSQEKSGISKGSKDLRESKYLGESVNFIESKDSEEPEDLKESKDLRKPKSPKAPSPRKVNYESKFDEECPEYSVNTPYGFCDDLMNQMFVIHQSSFMKDPIKERSGSTLPASVLSALSSDGEDDRCNCDCKRKLLKLRAVLQKMVFDNFSLKNKVCELNSLLCEMQSDPGTSRGKSEDSQHYNNERLKSLKDCEVQLETMSNQLCHTQNQLQTVCNQLRLTQNQLKSVGNQLFQSREKCSKLSYDLNVALSELEREKKLSEVYCLRIDELRALVNEKTLEANRLHQQCCDVKRKFLESQSIRVGQTKEITELRKKLCEMNSSKRELAVIRETFLNTHNNVISQLQFKLGKLEEASSSHKVEIQTLIEELIKKQDQLLVYAERELMMQESTKMKENEWMVCCQEGEKEILRLGEILCGLKDELERAQKAVETERSHHAATNERLSDSLNAISVLKSELGKKDCCVAKLQDALRNSGLKVANHVSRIDQLEAASSQLQQETWDLRNMLAKALKERSDCENELCKKTEEIKHLHIEMCKLRSEKDHLMKEGLKYKVQFDELNGNCAHYQDEVVSLKRQLNNCHNQYHADLKVMDDELSKRKEGMSNMQKEIKVLKRKLEETMCDSEKSLKMLKETAEEEINKNKRASFELRKELELSLKARYTLEQEVIKRNDIITGLQNEVIDKENTLKRIETKLLHLEDCLKHHMEENNALSSRLKQAVEEKRDLIDCMNKCNDSLDLLRSQLLELKSKCSTASKNASKRRSVKEDLKYSNIFENGYKVERRSREKSKNNEKIQKLINYELECDCNKIDGVHRRQSIEFYGDNSSLYDNEYDNNSGKSLKNGCENLHSDEIGPGTESDEFSKNSVAQPTLNQLNNTSFPVKRRSPKMRKKRILDQLHKLEDQLESKEGKLEYLYQKFSKQADWIKEKCKAVDNLSDKVQSLQTLPAENNQTVTVCTSNTSLCDVETVSSSHYMTHQLIRTPVNTISDRKHRLNVPRRKSSSSPGRYYKFCSSDNLPSYV